LKQSDFFKDLCSQVNESVLLMQRQNEDELEQLKPNRLRNPACFRCFILFNSWRAGL